MTSWEGAAVAMASSRLHTGHVGHIDEQGYVFITDRAKDLILVGGYNIDPRMVEEAILRYPKVEDVAVCGIPDDYRGETVKAFIVPRQGQTVTLSELKAFLRDKLAPFEIPRALALRNTLPRALIGKVSRKERSSLPVSPAAALRSERGPIHGAGKRNSFSLS